MVPISSSVGAALVALALAVSGCGDTSPHGQVTQAGAQTSPSTSNVHSRPTVDRAVPGGPVTRVLAVSIDGLRTSAITQLGRAGTPTLHRLMAHGASTLNARTEREMTVTLPNHTGMVTGRRINDSRGGHGVTWNDDRRQPPTVQRAAGHDVSSVFRVVHNANRGTALFASKTKFSLFERSWGAGINKYRIRFDNSLLARMTRRDLLRHNRGFTFLHLSAPDSAGHALGWNSRAYLDAVRATDRRLGRIVRTINGHSRLKQHLALLVTADHGGTGRNHSNATRLVNYRVPFVVWGPTVAGGASLYGLNPDYANPGHRRTAYSDARQPVRNGDVANLALDLLGLGPVPGSEHDRRQNLDWH
jgi:predicted AlkP superfamily pyrophosphatase or phosphodiesterase